MEKCQGKKNFAKVTVKRKETKQDAKGRKGVNYGKKVTKGKKRFMYLLIIGLMKTLSVLAQQNKDRRETTKVED